MNKRQIGIVLIAAGTVGLFLALGMDTSISTDMGERVHNIGLMQDKQNYIIASSVIGIAGLLLFIFGERSLKGESSSEDTRTCPLCAELIKAQAIKCRFCNADISPLSVDDPNTSGSISTNAGNSGKRQTTWLVCSIIAVGIAAFAYSTANDPNDRYAECWPFYTVKCQADVALKRLNSRF